MSPIRLHASRYTPTTGPDGNAERQSTVFAVALGGAYLPNWMPPSCLDFRSCRIGTVKGPVVWNLGGELADEVGVV
jgi:hypothetical protein